MQSLMNQSGYWPVYLGVLYSMLIFFIIWALKLSGLTWVSITRTANNIKWRRQDVAKDTTLNRGQATTSHSAEATTSHRRPPASETETPTSLREAHETEIRQRGTQFTSEPIRC